VNSMCSCDKTAIEQCIPHFVKHDPYLFNNKTQYKTRHRKQCLVTAKLPEVQYPHLV